MKDVEQQKKLLEAARAEFANDFRQLSSTLQAKAEHVSEVVRDTKDKVDLRKQLARNFWATAGVFVGLGFLATRMMRGSRSVGLSSSHIEKISREVANRLPAVRHSVVPRGPVLTTTLFTTLANIALSVYQARKERHIESDHESRREHRRATVH